MIIHPLPSRSRRFAIPGLSVADRLGTALAPRLDDGHHYLRAVSIGGARASDAILVGPGGTWALTFGVERGRFRKRNGHWYRFHRSTESWVPWDAQPVTDARLAGHRLEQYLERAALAAAVKPCLFTVRDMEVTWEADQRPGLEVHDDGERLAERIARDEILTPPQVDRIVALLDPRQPLPRLATSPQS